MEVLKRPGQAVLDSSAFDETILILVDHWNDHTLKSISQEFSYEFHRTIKEGYRPEVRNGCWTLRFRH